MNYTMYNDGFLCLVIIRRFVPNTDRVGEYKCEDWKSYILSTTLACVLFYISVVCVCVWHCVWLLLSYSCCSF